MHTYSTTHRTAQRIMRIVGTGCGPAPPPAPLPPLHTNNSLCIGLETTTTHTANACLALGSTFAILSPAVRTAKTPPSPACMKHGYPAAATQRAGTHAAGGWGHEAARTCSTCLSPTGRRKALPAAPSSSSSAAAAVSAAGAAAGTAHAASARHAHHIPPRHAVATMLQKGDHQGGHHHGGLAPCRGIHVRPSRQSASAACQCVPQPAAASPTLLPFWRTHTNHRRHQPPFVSLQGTVRRYTGRGSSSSSAWKRGAFARRPPPLPAAPLLPKHRPNLKINLPAEACTTSEQPLPHRPVRYSRRGGTGVPWRTRKGRHGLWPAACARHRQLMFLLLLL